MPFQVAHDRWGNSWMGLFPGPCKRQVFHIAWSLHLHGCIQQFLQYGTLCVTVARPAHWLAKRMFDCHQARYADGRRQVRDI